MSALSLALAGGAVIAVVMFVLWLAHFPLRNAAIVDFGWALGMALLGLGYAAFGRAPAERSLLLAVMAGIWGLRLAFHLLFDRVIGQEEEGRYREIRERWRTNIGAKFLAFFEGQALTCVILSLPFLAVSQNMAESIHPLEWVALGIWIAAVAGESLADAQLKAFKANPANKGRTCRAGLWRYSRHPNYFFEWLIWVSFAVLASASPWGRMAGVSIGWIAPAMILYFLLRVTGIPATEAHAVRSRGEEYRRYQRTTSAFIPWFSKEEAT